MVGECVYAHAQSQGAATTAAVAAVFSLHLCNIYYISISMHVSIHPSIHLSINVYMLFLSYMYTCIG